MFERFIIYLDQQLKAVKDVKEVVELKDELLANIMDKYDELIASGMKEEQAYQEAIKSIGDLTDVVNKFRSKQVVIEKNDSKKSVMDRILYRNISDEEYVLNFRRTENLNLF